MRSSVLLLVALLAVTCYGVSAQRPKSRGETGNTLLFAILDGNMDDDNCGGEGQPCCSNFRCKAAGCGCINAAAQKPMCQKCGGPNQHACPGMTCNDGTKVAPDALPYCPIRSTANPLPKLRAKTRRVVRQRRAVAPAGAVAGAAASAASAMAVTVNDDIAAAVSKPESVMAMPVAATMDAAVAVAEEEVVEVEVVASAAEQMAMVDMSAGTLNRPCRTQELWPGMAACDGGATCQFAGNGSPGICL